MSRLWEAWEIYPLEILFSCLLFSLIPWLIYRLKVQQGLSKIRWMEEKIGILEEEVATFKRKELTTTAEINQPVRLDDLKIVEGIGPKIELLCHTWGIHSFQDLAQTSVAFLRSQLQSAGPRYQMHDPTTWPEQAKLASEGRWDELKQWQDQLHKGKKINP